MFWIFDPKDPKVLNVGGKKQEMDKYLHNIAQFVPFGPIIDWIIILT